MRRLIAPIAVLSTLVFAGGASAAGGLEIKDVDTAGFPTVRVTVQAPHDGKAPELALSENGVPATNMVVSDPDAPAAVAVVIDTSHTMRGEKLDAAISAAKEFVTAQPADNVIGVYGFGDTAYNAAPLTTDRTQTATAIDQLTISIKPGTSLYGAVKLAATELRTAPAAKRVIVLLSDGESLKDSATIEQALTAADDAKAQVFSIGTALDSTAEAALTRISDETGGSFSSADSEAALSSVYASISDELASTYTITYQSLAQRGTDLDLAVSAKGFGEATQTLKAPGTFTPADDGGGLALPDNAGGRLALGVLAGLFVLLATTALLSARPGVVVQKRIAPYTEQRSPAQEALHSAQSESGNLSVLQSLFIATEKIIGSMNWWRKISAMLEQADLPLRTAELFYMQIGTGLLVGALTAFGLGRQGVFALIGVVVGAMLPVLFVRFKAKKRLNDFEHQLPETLITMAASLKAGHAFNQSMQSVVSEGADPTAKEFARVLAEVQLGMPAEQALDAMAKRMNSYNFGFVVMAVNIQRTVGGSLADILDMVADTVRQRQQFTKKVKALTAQGRASAYVLVAMPFLMGLAIFAVNGEYMQILWQERLGQMMIVGGCISMAIGSVVIKKIVDFKG